MHHQTGDISAGNGTREAPPDRKSVARAFLAFGLTSIGAGRHGYLLEGLVRKRRWLTAEEFADGLTIAHVLPGTTYLNMVLYCGLHLGGITMALTAGFLAAAPGTALIASMAVVIADRTAASAISGALDGVTIGASALIFVTLLRISRPILRSAPDVSVAVMALVMSLLTVPLPLIIGLLGGVNFFRPRAGYEEHLGGLD